jgi:metal-responsive CopG/Arc/MetJ family transcriptional regulator
MAIRKASRQPVQERSAVRTTFTLPADLLARVDNEVNGGFASSRNEFVRWAIAYALWHQEQERIDEAIRAAAADPEYIAEAEQIMKEFEAADAETARAITEEFGPYPVDAL